jgi:hypothetical protein
VAALLMAVLGGEVDPRVRAAPWLPALSITSSTYDMLPLPKLPPAAFVAAENGAVSAHSPLVGLVSATCYLVDVPLDCARALSLPTIAMPDQLAEQLLAFARSYQGKVASAELRCGLDKRIVHVIESAAGQPVISERLRQSNEPWLFTGTSFVPVTSAAFAVPWQAPDGPLVEPHLGCLSAGVGPC